MTKITLKLLFIVFFSLFSSIAFSAGLSFIAYGINGKEYPKYFNKANLSNFGSPIIKKHILMECGFSLPWQPESDWESNSDFNIWLVTYKTADFETNLNKAAVHSLRLTQNNYARFDKLTIKNTTPIQTLIKHGARKVGKDTYFIQDVQSDDGSGYIVKIARGYAVNIKPLNAC